MSDQKCDCCGEPLMFQWSDTHGVGACTTCGLPYRIFHYDENNHRIDRPPAPAVTQTGLEIAKRYWTERHRRVFPAAFDMGFLSGRERSYSGATEDDVLSFNEWYDTNVAEAVS